jgi:para-nitrobenzyl esterase
LAKKNVIVASFNYRLGALGFMPDAALTAEDGVTYGNQGLLDQSFALKWIKQNIAAFGGDPNNVTLFGQGSGATDVCYHMVSPQSRGLFQQAISESGGCTAYQYEERDVLPTVQQYKERLGCTGTDAIQCLRTVRVENLLAAAPTGNSPFRPFVDGNFLQE